MSCTNGADGASVSERQSERAAAEEVLAAALAFAARGWPVFPVNGKTPLTEHGFKDASRNEEQILAWWQKYPAAGVAIATGAPSGVLIVDVDAQKGGARTWKQLCADHGKVPPTAATLTGGGGGHLLFQHPGDVPSSTGKLGVHVDIRADGGYAILPPSVHENGRIYRWIQTVEKAGIAEPPAWIIELARGRRNGRPGVAPLDEIIPEGRRNAELASIAGTLRRRGLGAAEILATLREVNRHRCQPPLADDELERIAGSIGRYPPGSTLGVPAFSGPPRGLDDVVTTFQRHLHLPDPTPLLLALATVIANLMHEGDPVWLAVVGGSSRGKTEIVAAVDGFPGVRVIGALTVAALLSGTSRKDRSKDATGGILMELGDRGILVVKDLGAILTLHRDARAQVLQALRDVYDGLYTRDVGADGGTKLRWTGRIGLIAGATSSLDSAHAVLAALGERWVTVRLPESGESEMAKIALRHTDTAAMRAELRDAVHGFLTPLENVQLRPATPDEEKLLIALSSLVCLARSPVERDPYKRDIVYVHAPEGPGRIVRQLHKLLVALEAMGADDPVGTIVRAGLDSIPSPRRDVLLHLLEHGELSTTHIATTLSLPYQSTARACEELNAHCLIVRRKSGDADNSPNLWTPARRAAGFWQAINRPRLEIA
jgi:hypothetical protein